MTAGDFKRYKLYRGHYRYGIIPMLPQPLKIITVLRDPVQRVISIFKYHQRLSVKDPRFHWFRTNSLSDTLKDPWYSREYVNAQTSSLGPIELLTPDKWVDFQAQQRRFSENYGVHQYSEEFSQKPFSLDLAKERLEQLDCFGLSEQFSDFLQLLSFKFSWFPLKEVFENVAPQRAHSLDFDASGHGMILEKNLLDAELYAYAKKRFDQRLFEIHIDQLTQENLVRRAEQKISAAGRFAALRLDMDTPLPGIGWHQFEAGTEGHRWTGPETTSSLSLPLVINQSLRIRFKVIGTLLSDNIDGLSLSVNKVIIPLQRQSVIDPNGWVFEGIIPQKALTQSAPVARLIFTVPKTAIPNEINPESPDKRKLGVAVDWLEITPVT